MSRMQQSLCRIDHKRGRVRKGLVSKMRRKARFVAHRIHVGMILEAVPVVVDLDGTLPALPGQDQERG